MKINYSFVHKMSATVVALGLLVSLAPSALAQGAPVRKFSAAATPTSVASPSTESFTVTFTNDPTSDDDINSARITLPAGFTLDGSPSLSGTTGWEICTENSEVQMGKQNGNNAGTGIAPGESFSVSFSAEISASAGDYDFTARAFKNESCNPGGGAEFDSNQTPITVEVESPTNAAPVAANDSYSTDQDTPLTVVVADGVLDNDTDADNDSLTAVLDTDVSNGTLTLNSDGSFSYTPDSGFTGSDSFTYLANDGTADSNVATVDITVNAVQGTPACSNTADDDTDGVSDAADPGCHTDGDANNTNSYDANDNDETDQSTGPNRYTLTVDTSGEGDGMVVGDGINCDSNFVESEETPSNDCSEVYDEGTEVELTVTPDEGSSFEDSWTVSAGTCIGTTTPCTVTMNSNINLTAHFTVPSVTTTTSGGGSHHHRNRSSNDDEGEVLGAQTEVLPAGAPNTGMGGMAASGSFGTVLALMSVLGLAARKRI